MIFNNNIIIKLYLFNYIFILIIYFLFFYFVKCILILKNINVKNNKKLNLFQKF